MHLFGFTIEIYYDARPYERKIYISFLIRGNNDVDANSKINDDSDWQKEYPKSTTKQYSNYTLTSITFNRRSFLFQLPALLKQAPIWANLPEYKENIVMLFLSLTRWTMSEISTTIIQGQKCQL